MQEILKKGKEQKRGQSRKSNQRTKGLKIAKSHIVSVQAEKSSEPILLGVPMEQYVSVLHSDNEELKSDNVQTTKIKVLH